MHHPGALLEIKQLELKSNRNYWIDKKFPSSLFFGGVGGGRGRGGGVRGGVGSGGERERILEIMTVAASHDSEYPFLLVASCKFKPSAVKLSLTQRWTWSLRSRAQRPKHVLHAKTRGAQQSVQQLTRKI